MILKRTEALALQKDIVGKKLGKKDGKSEPKSPQGAESIRLSHTCAGRGLSAAVTRCCGQAITKGRRNKQNPKSP